MNIVLGEVQGRTLAERHVVLPLDMFKIQGQPELVKSYCVIESLSLEELAQIDYWVDLHVKLIENYGKQNWNFCLQALEHLMGRWNGEIDSFYQNLLDRVQQYQISDPGPDWIPAIPR